MAKVGEEEHYSLPVFAECVVMDLNEEQGAFMQCRLGLAGVLCLMAVGLTNLAVAQTSPVMAADPQWDVPPAAAPEGFLPKLGTIQLDGDLTEWGAAAAVPLRFASYIAHIIPLHTWNGPADCGMEALCGWNEEGLCLAAFVADDDVQNDTPPDKSYEKDRRFAISPILSTDA